MAQFLIVSFLSFISSENSEDKTGTVAGTLTVGGTDTKLHQTPLVFAEGHVSSSIMDRVTIHKLYSMKPDSTGLGMRQRPILLHSMLHRVC